MNWTDIKKKKMRELMITFKHYKIYIGKHIKKILNLQSSKKENKRKKLSKMKKYSYTDYIVYYQKSSTPTIPESSLLQEEVNNLEKILRILQAPTKMMLFLLPGYYKTI